VDKETGETAPLILLVHGTTTHGTQAKAEEYKTTRLSYYSDFAGVTEAMEMVSDFEGQQKVAVLGLGAGVMACYQKEGRVFDFYEIDPAIAEVAEDPKLFRFLSDCGSPYEIILGDGRLKIQDQPSNIYDVLVIDVFSSDSIPIHLLTTEAFEIYMDKLKNDGLVIMNISNNFMNLQPVLARAAEGVNRIAYRKLIPYESIDGHPTYPADWLVMIKPGTFEERLEESGWERLEPDESFRVWTDQYSNILKILR
jgi:spermidine synthase